MSNINYTLRKSVSVNFVGRYANIAVQLLVTAILARMLSPMDFGVMAIVSVLVTFFSFLSEMGLGPAIIQFRELDRTKIAGLFWVSIVVGLVSGVVFANCGPMIANVYKNPRYVSIAYGLGITIALSCWTVVPLALLRRAQRFKAIIIIEVGSAGASGVAAVIAAYCGAGVFALVIKSIAYAFLMFSFCWACSRLSMLDRPSIRGMRGVFVYSAYQFMFNLVNYFTRNLDKLMVGKMMGVAQLGLYDMSYRLMLMPVSNLTSVITPALQPVYAAHQNDKDLIFSSYQKLVRVLVVLGGFLGILCYLCSDDIILLVYGPKWGGAIPIFSILSISIAIQVVLSSTGAIYQVIGRTDLLFTTGLLSAIVTVSAILVGALSGNLILLSWVLVVSFFLNAVQGFYILVRKGFGYPVLDLFGPSLKSIVGVIILELACVAIKAVMLDINWPFALVLVCKVAFVVVTYFMLALVTGDIAFMRRALSRRQPA